jgi:predicted permease
VSLRRKLAYLLPWRRRAEDRDIQEELEALRDIAGPAALGNLTLAAEDARAAFTWTPLERLVQDVRYTLRAMRRQKAFTALVVVSLALGIGANTAIFSFMESVLLRPLPVRDPDALVVMKWRAKGYALATSGMSWSTGGSSFDEATGTLSSIFPYAALQAFDDAGDIVDTAFGYFSATRLAVTANGETEPVKGLYVSGQYFYGMGIAPAAAGRLIHAGDDDPASAAVAVISHRLGLRRFGHPAAAVGQTIRINDKPFVVIGVAPPAFFGAEPGAIPDVYVPMRADTILESAASAGKYTDSGYFWVEIMARLKPGVSVAEAQAALAPRFHQFVAGLATADEQRQDLPALVVQSGATGLDSLRRRYAQPIYILTGMVGLILLVACSNIASLLLSRAAARRREIAVRLSIGASRGRVVRQLLTESVLLASIGGALGVAIAWWGIRVLTQLLANGRDNFTLHAELNWAVLGATLALSLVTGLLFGLAPALQAARVDVAPALKDVRAGSGPLRPRRLMAGQTLVVAQLVLSLVLLIAAGLFGRTLAKLHAIELGFDRENVLLFAIRPSTIGYRGPELSMLYERLRGELGRLPRVQSVSLSTAPLPMGGGTMGPVVFVDAPSPSRGPDEPSPSAVYATVGPAFFTTMRIPVSGRDFADGDTAGAPKVAIVNRRLAAMSGLPNPIGRTIAIDTRAVDTGRYEIVGVVEDALAFALKEEKRPVVYFTYLQLSRPPGQMTYEIRTVGPPLTLAAAVRQTVRDVDARLAIHDLETQSAHVDQAISTEITLARLCAAFAALALAIACVGLYGTVSFAVARRTHEIGIRMTLGAQRQRIRWMILRDVLVLTTVGLAIGIPLALAGSRYVRAFLYGIEPHDPAAIGIALAALVICGLMAGLVPARRASRIDPMAAMRHE